MAVTYGANGFMKVQYLSLSNVHFHKFWIELGDFDPFNNVEVFQNGGTAVDISVAVNNWKTAFLTLLPTSANLVDYEVYSQPTEGSDPQPVWADDFGDVGTRSGTATALLQEVLSWRTALGHYGKVTVIESSGAANARQSWRSGSPSAFNTFRTYLIGSTSMYKGFDGAAPVGTLFYTSKINDILRKKEILDN